MLHRTPVLIALIVLTSGSAFNWVVIGLATGIGALLHPNNAALTSPAKSAAQIPPCVEEKIFTKTDGTQVKVYWPAADQSQCPK